MHSDHSGRGSCGGKRGSAPPHALWRSGNCGGLSRTGVRRRIDFAVDVGIEAVVPRRRTRRAPIGSRYRSDVVIRVLAASEACACGRARYLAVFRNRARGTGATDSFVERRLYHHRISAGTIRSRHLRNGVGPVAFRAQPIAFGCSASGAARVLQNQRRQSAAGRCVLQNSRFVQPRDSSYGSVRRRCSAGNPGRCVRATLGFGGCSFAAARSGTWVARFTACRGAHLLQQRSSEPRPLVACSSTRLDCRDLVDC